MIFLTNNKLPVKINNIIYICISKKYSYYEDKAKIKTVDIKKKT